MKKPSMTHLFILLSSLNMLAVLVSAREGLGISSWAGWNPKQVSRQDCPELRSVPFILGWKKLEPQPRYYEFDKYVGDQLRAASDDGLYVTLMIWVRPSTPDWLFTDKGVPRVYTDRDVNPLGKKMSKEDNLHPYYFHPEYKKSFFALIDAFGDYVNRLPSELRERIIFFQSAEGSTGDGQPYKGTPLDSQYKISEADWNDFRRQTWMRYQKALPGIPILVNSDANTQEETEWMFANLDVIALKHGMFSHGYHVSDNVQRLQKFDAICEVAQERGVPVLTRGEMDGEMFVYAWSTRNIAQAVYWSGLFATHCRLDLWNIPHKALKDEYAQLPAYAFFNRYAGLHDPTSSPRAFCALRDGLNAADVDRFPVREFGPLKKSNQQRYLNIAAAYAPYGARMDDPEKVMGGGMKNRKRMGYNDVGWNILPGNYSRFLTQIRPGSEDIGWWHVDRTKQGCSDAEASIYSRFARGFDNAHAKNAMYFDLHDDLFGNSDLRVGVTLSVIYYDDVRNSTWELQYDRGGAIATALSVTNTGSKTWKTAKVTITDAAFHNSGPFGADMVLKNTDTFDDIFHLIEVELNN